MSRPKRGRKIESLIAVDLNLIPRFSSPPRLGSGSPSQDSVKGDDAGDALTAAIMNGQ